MQHEFDCPVCNARSWRCLEKKTYRRADISAISPYLQRQYRVLFEVWFVGQDEVTITSVLCERCGFVTFLPRPTEKEVTQKYEHQLRIGTHSRGRGPEYKQERMRGERLYAEVSPLISADATVLDYGGGRGRLMTPFVHSGHRCYIVDYVRDPIAGVEYLGSTVDCLRQDQLFDVIIVSHVLEHVADPVRLVRILHQHHSNGGLLFVEVPMQLWRHVPPHGEPVTHVNFFSPFSLKCVLARSGYQIRRCNLKWHYTERTSLVVRAIAHCVNETETPSLEKAAAYSMAMLESTLSAAFRIFKAGLWRALVAIASARIRKIRRGRKRISKGSFGSER